VQPTKGPTKAPELVLAAAPLGGARLAAPPPKSADMADANPFLGARRASTRLAARTASRAPAPLLSRGSVSVSGPFVLFRPSSCESSAKFDERERRAPPLSLSPSRGAWFESPPPPPDACDALRPCASPNVPRTFAAAAPASARATRAQLASSLPQSVSRFNATSAAPMIAATCKSICAAASSRRRSIARRSATARSRPCAAPAEKERPALNGLRPSDGESAAAATSAAPALPLLASAPTAALDLTPTASRCRRLLVAACSTTIVSSSSRSAGGAAAAPRGSRTPDKKGASVNELARSPPSANSSGSCDALLNVRGMFAECAASRGACGAPSGAARAGGAGAIARAHTVKGAIAHGAAPAAEPLPPSRSEKSPGSIASVMPNAWPRCALGAVGAVASTEYLCGGRGRAAAEGGCKRVRAKALTPVCVEK
jgi:hypothetical protein